MEFEKFTERSRGFIQSAQSLAIRETHQQFTPLHLLKVLLDDKEGLAASLIDEAGGNAQRALRLTEGELKRLPKVESDTVQIYLASETAKLFDQSEQIAEKAGDSFVTVEMLLLAMAMAEGTDACKVLKEAGLTPQDLNTAIKDFRMGRSALCVQSWTWNSSRNAGRSRFSAH